MERWTISVARAELLQLRDGRISRGLPGLSRYAPSKAAADVIFVLVVFSDGSRSINSIHEDSTQTSSLEVGLVSRLAPFHGALPMPADCVAGSAEAPGG